MSTAQTVAISVEATLFAGAVLAVAREAIRKPWVKFSWSVSVGVSIVPAEKRFPEPDAGPPRTAAAPVVIEPPAGAAVLNVGRGPDGKFQRAGAA
jgi:hypothetical protein